MYISTSVSSLLIYKRILNFTKYVFYEKLLRELGCNEKEKRNKKIINSFLFLCDALYKTFSYYIKIQLNESIYKIFDYSINKWLFLFSYFLIYIICGIIPILILINTEDPDDLKKEMKKRKKKMEKLEKIHEKNKNKENKNNNEDNIEETEILIIDNPDTINFFGNISYKHKRTTEMKKINDIDTDYDINIIDIKKKVQNKIDNKKIIKQLNLVENAEVEEKIDNNKKVSLNEAIKNIKKRKSPFRLVYEKEGIISYLWKFIKNNKLIVFLILYFIYNLTSMNFYNIIEDNYFQKKTIEYLKSRQYEYLLLVFYFGFLIAITNFFFNVNEYYQLAYIYLILFLCNYSLIKFYALKLFKNYYDFTKKKSDDMNLEFIQLFLNANLYSFVIQNIYIEKEGNDYLSINAISGMVDFAYFVIEFIIYQMINNDTLIKILNYVSFFVSCIVELFLFVVFFLLFILYFGTMCECCKNFTNNLKKFLRWLKII
jgi:hypothetical protein